MNSPSEKSETLDGEQLLQNTAPKSPEVDDLLASFEAEVLEALAEWDSLTPEEKDAKRREILWKAKLPVESIEQIPSEAIQKFLAA